MSSDRQMRASDQDREWAADVLGDAYAVGRLDYEEFDERSTAAFSVRTPGELDDLTADLPGPRRPRGVPADIVAPDRMSRQARWCMIAQMAWMLAMVLAVGLVGGVIPAVAWAAATLVPFVITGLFTFRDVSRAASAAVTEQR